MNDQRADMAKEIQELFQKTAEANRLFLSEGAKFVSQLAKGNIQGEKLASLQRGLLTDAFTTYVKLGLQYTSNLVDLGLAFSKRLSEELSQNEDNPPAEEKPDTRKPAFVLTANGAPGTTTRAEFLLDSDKQDPILCHLKQTGYALQDNPDSKRQFETSFAPQSFQLMPGVPQKVEITVAIPADAEEGIYVSHMQVEGFEHIFFSLYLNVALPNDQNMPS